MKLRRFGTIFLGLVMVMSLMTVTASALDEADYDSAAETSVVLLDSSAAVSPLSAEDAELMAGDCAEAVSLSAPAPQREKPNAGVTVVMLGIAAAAIIGIVVLMRKKK